MFCGVRVADHSACACAGGVPNSDSAPSSSARQGTRKVKRRRRPPGRGSGREEPAGADVAGRCAPARRRTHVTTLAAGLIVHAAFGADVKRRCAKRTMRVRMPPVGNEFAPRAIPVSPPVATHECLLAGSVIARLPRQPSGRRPELKSQMYSPSGCAGFPDPAVECRAPESLADARPCREWQNVRDGILLDSDRIVRVPGIRREIPRQNAASLPNPAVSCSHRKGPRFASRPEPCHFRYRRTSCCSHACKRACDRLSLPRLIAFASPL